MAAREILLDHKPQLEIFTLTTYEAATLIKALTDQLIRGQTTGSFDINQHGQIRSRILICIEHNNNSL